MIQGTYVVYSDGHLDKKNHNPLSEIIGHVIVKSAWLIINIGIEELQLLIYVLFLPLITVK